MGRDDFKEYWNRRLREENKWSNIDLALVAMVWIIGFVVGYMILN